MNSNTAVGITVLLACTIALPLEAQFVAPFELAKLVGTKVIDPPTPLERADIEFEATGHARIISPRNPGDFTIYPFGFSQPHLTCGALKLCQIELERGESLSDEPLLGDRERWNVDQTRSDDIAVVVVKPNECDIQTNLLLVTDRRRYVIDLDAPACEGTNPAGTYMTGISFWYPGEKPRVEENKEPDALEGMLVDVRELNTNYRWQTSRRVSWNPMRIFDDGVRTIIQFTPDAHHGEMPVLYGLAEDGTRVQVNVVPRPDPDGDYLIADRVLTRGALVLRDGKRERKLNIDNLTLLRR